jgi:hypothetical protein
MTTDNKDLTDKIRLICSGSQSIAVAIDQHYNGWEKGTDKKSQIRSFS